MNHTWRDRLLSVVALVLHALDTATWPNAGKRPRVSFGQGGLGVGQVAP